jgi:hypothetical protein
LYILDIYFSHLIIIKHFFSITEIRSYPRSHNGKLLSLGILCALSRLEKTIWCLVHQGVNKVTFG